MLCFDDVKCEVVVRSRGSVIERYNDVIETMMICRGVSVAFRRYDIDP